MWFPTGDRWLSCVQRTIDNPSLTVSVKTLNYTRQDKADSPCGNLVRNFPASKNRDLPRTLSGIAFPSSSLGVVKLLGLQLVIVQQQQWARM